MADWIYYTHAGGFFAAALAAFLVGVLAQRARVRTIAWGNAVPLLVSALTYLVLRTQPPEARWLGYTVACGFFAYETALALRRPGERAAWAGVLMALTLFTGYAVYLVDGMLDKSLVFALGSAAYACSLYLLALELPRGAWTRLYLAAFVASWSAYAVIFGLGPAFGGVLGSVGEELAYFVLEFAAKYGVAAANIWIAASEKEKRHLYR
jgi:bacteriorhodopsin